MEVLHNLDIAVFYFINQTCKNSILDLLMPWITKFGGGMFLFAGAVIFLFLKSKRIKEAGIFLLAGLTVSYYITRLIKILTARPRPFKALDMVNVLAGASDYSFPSAHATMIFVAAYLLSNYFKKWYIFYPIAAIVGFSRIYVGVHYPSDVITGAILGIALGYVLVRVTKNVSIIKNRGEK